MKRFGILMLALVMCVAAMPNAGAEYTRESFYEMGLTALENMDAESAALAADHFNAASGYALAPSYLQYAQSLHDMLSTDADGDISMAIYRLQRLQQFPQYDEFAASLAEHHFPSCPDLIVYAEALQAERNGDYAQAQRKYDTVSWVLDAMQRSFDLTPKVYEQGKRLLEEKRYDEALTALEGLKWQDSEALYQRAYAEVHPTPTPTPIPTPTPTPTPTPEPTPTPTTKPQPTSTPTPIPSPSPKRTPAPLRFTEIRELDLNPHEDFSLHVSWSGGSGPYELCCYHYFNDNHNAGINKCMDKMIFYDSGRRKDLNSGITAVNASGAWIRHMASGQTYWIVVKDSAGHSAWEKYTIPRLEFSDFTAKLSGLSFKKWKGSLEGNGSDIKVLKAEDLENSFMYELTKEDGIYYGLQVSYSISGFKVGFIYYSFNYILILPNGDEYVDSWGFPELKKQYTGYSFNIGFDDIYRTYGEIPVGTYKLIATINGYIVGEKEFKIQ